MAGSVPLSFAFAVVASSSPPRDVAAPPARPARALSPDDRPQESPAVDIEVLGLRLAKVAGEVLAVVRGVSLVDAVVVASAAQRGDLVLTGDMNDLLTARRELANSSGNLTSWRAVTRARERAPSSQAA